MQSCPPSPPTHTLFDWTAPWESLGSPSLTLSAQRNNPSLPLPLSLSLLPLFHLPFPTVEWVEKDQSHSCLLPSAQLGMGTMLAGIDRGSPSPQCDYTGWRKLSSHSVATVLSPAEPSPSSAWLALELPTSQTW